MKQTLFVSATLLLFLACSLEAAPDVVDFTIFNDEQKKAVEVLDNTDVEQLLSDKDAVDAKIACVLEETSCDGDEVVESIRVLLPLRLNADDCIGCTSEQKAKMIKLAKFVKYNLHDRYDQLLQKFANGEERPELAAL